MTQPRNVTPGYEPDAASSGDGPRWMGWAWDSRGHSFPWLGVLLVMVGAGLLIQYFVPALSATTLILGGIALAFLAGWLIGRSYVAVIPGLLIGALVVARVVDELKIYTGPGTTSLAVAVAFLLIWVIGASRRRASTWPLYGAGIFGLIGFVELAGHLALPELGALWPALIIVVGVVVLIVARSGAQRSITRRF
jgi:hypothetical protein